MKIICYTTIFDNYDDLLIPIHYENLLREASFLCFTDNKNLQSDFWEIIHVDRIYEDPTRENRYFKLCAHEVLPKHEISIYIDGNVQLKAFSLFPFINLVFSNNYEMAILKHPKRNCLYDEGDVCITKKKDNMEIIKSQLDFYKLSGFPELYGLWACTIIFRKNTVSVKKICQDWFEQVLKYSRRDQISLPYVFWSNKFFKFSTLDWNWENNDFYKLYPHQNVIKNMSQRPRYIVELGCGNNKRIKDAIGIDQFEFPGVDYVCDLNEGMPFLESNSVDEIYSHHLLEHLIDLPLVMNEVYRVLKPGGIFRGEVPHFSNPYYFSDPTHKVLFGLYSFNYFIKDQSKFRRKVPEFYNDLNFEIVNLNLVFKNKTFNSFVSRLKFRLYNNFFNSNFFRKECYEWYWSKFIACYEIKFSLRKIH